MAERPARAYSCACVCALALAACSAGVDEAPGHTLWTVEGARNTVYLLGSVHVLRESDYPLGAPLLAAYEAAEALMMELDMDDLDVAAVQRQMLTLGTATAGDDLRQVLGPEDYLQAARRAGELGLSLDDIAQVEPWFAALLVVQQRMVQLGFDTRLGVESMLAQRAVRDGKTIDGLETLAEQLAIFDSMPLPLQRELFLKSLEDAEDLAQLDTMIDAWRTGDIVTLHAELDDAFTDFPALYDALVRDRNRRWLGRIEPLLAQPEDYLVVVGALHLVGPDSVVALLRDRGFQVEQQ